MPSIKIPTSKVFEKLSVLYLVFIASHSHKYNADTLFEKSLPASLVPYYRHLVSAIPNSGTRRRVLRKLESVHFWCKLCDKPMCGTKAICSEACIASKTAQTAKEAGWALKRLYNSGRGTLPTRIRATCLECGKTQDKTVGYFLAGFSCLCQRGQKISDTQKWSHEDFAAAVKSKGLQIKILSSYTTQCTPVIFKCLVCGDTCESLPGNILTRRGCFTCGKQKYKDNCLAGYGVKNHVQRPDVQTKIRKSMVANWGVPHALQNTELFHKMQKTSSGRHAYKLGKHVVYLQGYEPLAIDWLLANTSLKPHQIWCGTGSDVPSVPYKINGSVRVYHPDMFIPHLNLLVEVKSLYTYRYDTIRIRHKAKACKRSGYRFGLLVMNADGTRHYDYKTSMD